MVKYAGVKNETLSLSLSIRRATLYSSRKAGRVPADLPRSLLRVVRHGPSTASTIGATRERASERAGLCHHRAEPTEPRTD
jgi:hypothetical protein